MTGGSTDRAAVLMVTPQYTPMVDGGTERQAQRLAEGIAGRGWRVGVVTAKYPGLAAHEEIGAVDVHRVWTVPKPGRFSATFLPSLTTFLLRHGRRFDIWHVHQAYYSALVSLRLARLLGKPCVVKAAASGPYGDVARLRKARMGSLVLRALPHADAVISLNAGLTQELVAAGVAAERIRLIANGVDCDAFRPPSRQERIVARSALGVPPDATVAAFAGRLDIDKGVDTLIDAWRRIERHAPAECCHLFLAGAGPRARDCQAAASGMLRVRFLGKLPDIRSLLAAADLMVHPSLTEGISNVVLEAMASGLPVIASAIAGLTEQVIDRETGLLVLPGDSRALADSVRGLLGDPARRARMGDAARRLAESSFSLSRMVDAYERLYMELSS